ncbi:hypothetical protein D3C76_1617190 [compost metagenome]
MNTVLKMYRENGTQDWLSKFIRSMKLFIVGLRTNSRGGNRKISSSGLKALLMA